jgi:exopolysaccharide biosynthesis polyprenyl glycosylphosphotransferase
MMPLAHRVHVWATRRATERVVVVGSGSQAEAITRRLLRHRTITVVGKVDDQGSDAAIGDIAELAEICERHQVDRVVVALSTAQQEETVDLLRRLDPRLSISVVPRLSELCTWNVSVEEFDGVPLLHIPRPRLTGSSKAVKRAMDLLIAGGVLLALLPLLAVIALAIKLDSRGPVFFRQARTGQGGRKFMIVKFRTMRVNAESELAGLAARSDTDGPIFKMREDPRVTRVGRWLRRTSLDELPQFLNVLVGDMSVVGPRPFPVHEANRIADWSVARTEVRPGITGLWQISGRSDLTADDLRYLDTVYVACWSIWWDFRILLRTPAALLHRSGAY